MFLSFILLLMLFGPICPLSVPDIPNEDSGLETKPEIPFSTHYLNSLDHKIETIITTLSTVDTSIKQLQEKAHTWAIFRHHIDSWNDQMKVLEHKIDLIRRTQDENQMISQKLTSQEFTLNHILSKVVYLSDSCNSGGGAENTILRFPEDGFGEIRKLLNGDRKIRNEIGTRLSNILRHVQNIERENCRSFRSNVGVSNGGGSGGGVGVNRMGNLLHPISSCNGSRSNDNIDLSLQVIEGKINKLIGSIPKKELKQLVSNEQANLKKFEEILEYLERIDDRTNLLFDADAENRAKLTNLCQSMSSEVTTFTGSSDILLKKIEQLVRDVQAKVDKLAKGGCMKETSPEEDDRKELPTNGKTDENGDNQSEEKDEIDDRDNNPVKNTTDEVKQVDEVENGSSETQDPQEEVNFVQPTYIGCHELPIRVDGIYKFSTPELNEAGRDMNERYCVFSTDGPAWTVIQNRGPYVVQENFNRSWNEYRDGFGSLDKDFWLGNEFIHQLAYIDDYEMRIELEDFDEVKTWVEYTTFRIDTEKYNYNLMIGGYRGAIADAMTYHNEHDFSTYDRRNDKSVDACCACATGYASGWWFDNCAEANLNGVFHETPLGHNYVGIVWDPWHGDYSLKSSKIMIRPKVWPKEEAEEFLKGSSEDP